MSELAGQRPEPAEPAEPQSRRLRTYLGTAPGVGKTYAMLSEAWRRAESGEKVVVGWIERHGRRETKAQLRDLEIVSPRMVLHRDREFEELDLDAVMAAGPNVVLVDELAHTNADGKRRRWEEVADLLDAGLTVMTTANVANLSSVRDYAARITGAGTVESLPDEFVRSGEVVLIDLPPGALRQRIASGRVYSADRVGGALANYFRASNLEALSELGKAWMEGTVDTVGEALLARQGVGPFAPRPAVVAGVSGSDQGERVIRRAVARAAEQDAELIVAHVSLADGLSRVRAGDLDRYRDMTVAAGGSFVELQGESPADLANAARDHNAVRVVVARHRSRLGELLGGSVALRLRRRLPDLEVEEVRPDD